MSKTPRKPAATDWARVQREAMQELTIAHAAADGPYDPNDVAAVKAYWRQTRINDALREAVAHGLTKA